MKRADVDRAVLDVYVRVFSDAYLKSSENTALNLAQRAATLAQQDLERMVTAQTRKRRAEAITPSDGAKRILEAYEVILARLPQPEKPLTPQVWAMLNTAARSAPPEVWERRFKIVMRSGFLMGRDAKFSATLPWLLKASTAADIDGGKYGAMG